MTRTATELRIDPAIARKGQFVRFDAMGLKVLEVTDRLTNGLGVIYQANGNATFTRYFF